MRAVVKRALVTGSAGFVGGHFCRRLTADGWWVDGMDIVEGVDCREYFAVDDDSPSRYDLVIHCAAIVGGRATIEGQPMAVATDLAIDADLWQWALRTRPGRIVYFSSSAAYPTKFQTGGSTLRLREDDIWLTDIAQPDQTYGLAKLVGEIQAAHVRNEGVPVTVVRPFSGYGEDQAEDYPFRAIIERARRRENPFEIWGDGEQTRDFIHIDDIVNAVMTMVDQGIDGPANLCTGRPTTMRQLARMACNATGHDPEFNYVLNAPRGVRYRVGDPTLMRSFYTPRITLEEGVARALAAVGSDA